MIAEDVKRVAIFIRISDEKKVTGKRISPEETLKNHKEILTGHCEKNGYEYELFTEIISGGTENLEDRTALKEMLENVHRFDAILVTEISRLSRESLIAATIKRYVKKYRKLILTPEAVYNLNNASDELMYDVGNAVAVHERTVIGKRIKNNKLSMAKQGLNASGSVPLGYIRNSQTKKLEIDSEKSHIPATAFYLCLKGWGSAKIQNYFNENGYTTKRGKAFTKRAITDLLIKETYKGFTVYHDVEKEMIEDVKTGEMFERRRTKETIVVPDTHPAIVSPEVFDAVQVIRSKRESNAKGSARDKPSEITSLLKDLIYCGKCKRKMRIVYDQKRGHMIKGCYDVLPDGSKCPNSGSKTETIESMVLNDLFSYEEKLEEEIKQLESSNHEKLTIEKNQQKKDLEKQLTNLDKEAEQLANVKIQLLMDMNNNDVMEKVIQEKIETNSKARENVKEKLSKLNKSISTINVESEIQKREIQLTTMKKLKKEKDTSKINNFLKQIIYKINYAKILPDEIAVLGGKNPIRKNFMPNIEIKYAQ